MRFVSLLFEQPRYNKTESRPVLGARLAIKTEKQKIALGEDLKISAYCVCGTKDDTAKDVTAKLLMSYSRIDPDNMIETVKEIDDGKESGYTWNGSFKNIKSVNITVPASAFTKAEVNDGEEPRWKEPMFYHYRKANGENNYYM